MPGRLRNIVKIDEEKCDGCGLCVPSCAEGAIRIVDGKARLVAENLCDGLGACLGECPQGAITVESRVADDYDETQVTRHLGRPPVHMHPGGVGEQDLSPGASPRPPGHIMGGCPGAALRTFRPPAPVADAGPQPSQLSQWPIQLMLVPPTAPFLKGRELVLAADCCGFALPDFHQRWLAGRSLLVGCPKLDDLGYYQDKLTEVFRASGCTGVAVLVMEVPCCAGLIRAAEQALAAARVDLPLREIVVGIRGEIRSERWLNRPNPAGSSSP